MKNQFDLFVDEYDEWFRKNPNLFESELRAIQKIFPKSKVKSLEIGVGSGIFAEKLGIEFGVDPSENMLLFAQKRGVKVKKGIAEILPYSDSSFDLALFITSLCFISDPEGALLEAYRVLNENGSVIVAFIKKDSVLGETIEASKNESKFYKGAQLFTTAEMITLLENAGFKINQTVQSLFNLSGIEPEQPKDGYDQGSFIVIKANKVT